VKTSAAHTKKSELKNVKAIVQSPIKARGAASLLQKLTGQKYTANQVTHLMKKKHRKNMTRTLKRSKIGLSKMPPLLQN
jgi:hypothetical protein